MDIDIGIILTGIAGVLGAIAVLVTAFRKKNNEEGSTPTERTLDNVWMLITKLQEERTRCDERVEALEAEQRKLRAEFKLLEIELRKAYRKNNE